MSQYGMGSKYILIRCNLKSWGGEEGILFLKLLMFVAVGDSLVGEGIPVEMGSEEDLGKLVIIWW